MIRNFKPSYKEEDISYERSFLWKDDPSGGFAFPCYENGNLKPFYSDMAESNYQYCINNPDKFIDEGVIEIKNEYTVPASGTCGCGCEVELTDDYMGACSCPDCGQWYNMAGQELNPPEKWRENDDYGDDEEIPFF